MPRLFVALCLRIAALIWLTALLQMVLSLWLVFGARGFSHFLFRIRTGGVAK